MPPPPAEFSLQGFKRVGVMSGVFFPRSRGWCRDHDKFPFKLFALFESLKVSQARGLSAWERRAGEDFTWRRGLTSLRHPHYLYVPLISAVSVFLLVARRMAPSRLHRHIPALPMAVTVHRELFGVGLRGGVIHRSRTVPRQDGRGCESFKKCSLEIKEVKREKAADSAWRRALMGGWKWSRRDIVSLLIYTPKISCSRIALPSRNASTGCGFAGFNSRDSAPR